MYQVPATVWNRIAETETLATEWAELTFPLPEAELEEALELEAARIQAEHKTSPSLTLAYLKVMPLLWEREAIAAFVADNPALAGALPNVETVEEAVRIATLDHPITTREQDKLASLLTIQPT